MYVLIDQVCFNMEPYTQCLQILNFIKIRAVLSFGKLSFIGSAGLYGSSAGLYGGSARLYGGSARLYGGSARLYASWIVCGGWGGLGLIIMSNLN